MVQTPKNAVDKAGANSLEKLERISLESCAIPRELRRGLYSYTVDPFCYEFIYNPGEENRLFVLLSGYADRERLTPPIFQRWSWQRYFPGHCLYIADPSLHLDKNLGLAWYVGTKKASVLPSLVELITQVAERIGVDSNDIILYASSGGGFAALKLAALMPEVTSVVINPQTDITRYDNRSVERFLRICFEGAKREEARLAYPERLSVFADIDRLRNSKIVYAQNLIDPHHISDHFLPFSDAVGLDEQFGYCSQNIQSVFFKNEGGHAKGETTEIFPHLISRAIALTRR